MNHLNHQVLQHHQLPSDRSLLAEKAFEFKSEDDTTDDDDDDEIPVRKTPSVKIKLKNKHQMIPIQLQHTS
jgi:hypothetical protein